MTNQKEHELTSVGQQMSTPDNLAYQELSEDFLNQYKDVINWTAVSMRESLSEDLIRKFQDYIDWKFLSMLHPLSVEFIREFKDKLNWECLTMYREMDEEFIREFSEYVDWYILSTYTPLSEDLIREFKDKVDWNSISLIQDLSEDFIREYQDSVNWSFIFATQKLTEGFLREFESRFTSEVSRYQPLSEAFIREFQDKLDWNNISKYQKLSSEFIEEFKDRLDMDAIKLSWHYKTADEKKKAVKKTNLYECHDDYFIAYEKVRKNNYSVLGFHHKFEKGKTYEAWCDYYGGEPWHWHGLGAWSKNNICSSLPDLVAQVRINYEDVAKISATGQVICSKFEIVTFFNKNY